MDEPQAASPRSDAPAWAAILEDVAHPAALLDGSGRVLRANALFARACGLGEISCDNLELSQARPDLWQVLAPLLMGLVLPPGSRSARWQSRVPGAVPRAFEISVRAVPSAEAHNGEARNGEARDLVWLSLRAAEAEDGRGAQEGSRGLTPEARAEYFEQRYRLLSESIPQIVWAARPDGALSFINRRGVEYFGIDPDNVDGAQWSAFLHPDDVEPTLRQWAQVRQSHRPLEVRYRLRRHDGSYRWFLGLGHELPAQNGSPAQWVGTCTDIDEPQRAEGSLRLLADAGEILTSSLDEAGPLQALAQRLVPGLADWCLFERVLPGAPVGRLELLALAHRDPSQLELLREMRQHALGARQSPDVNRVIIAGQSELVPVIDEEMLQHIALDEGHRKYLLELGFASLVCVPLRARGTSLGLLLLARGPGRPFEAPDQALAEEVARRAAGAMDNAALYRQAQGALRAAEEAGRAKDSFLATVSHELRTPLTAILGWANLLKSGRVDADMTRSALETIERNVKAQAQIIEDLLDVSRIVAGKLLLEMRPVELAPIVAGAIQATTPAIDAKNIELLFDPPGMLGDQNSPRTMASPAGTASPAVVSGDAVRLQQVVWNILSNAVKFTPRGGRIEVTISARGSQVVLTVRDSGPGVPPDFEPHLFERFRQADSSSTRRHGGLGLGLAIVRHLVEMHGGSVRLEPTVQGEGACFVVELPLLAIAGEVEKPQSGDDFAHVMLRGRSVLVVEDEADSLQLLLVVLRRFGAHVRGAASVAEAWAALGEEKPDVLVSDIGMPGEDGYSLIRRVRALFSPEELPALALTAYAANADRERALAEGFDAHVAKPASPIHLAMSVAALLEARRGAST